MKRKSTHATATRAFTTRPGNSASRRVLLVAVFIALAATAFFYIHGARGAGTLSQERLQFVVYGHDTRVYSLGLADGIHYVISYPAQFKIETPGGYGEYRVGALGHLVEQEQRPMILTQAMSLAAHTMIPYYFYRPSKTIWYESSTEASDSMPGWYDIATMDSNASVFERILIWQAVARVSRGDIIAIPAADAHVVNPGGDKALSNYKLQKQLEAYLYQETYRREEMNVQIIYDESYKTADRIASILEGTGINVVDLSVPLGKKTTGTCVVASANAAVDESKTVRDIAQFFGCRRSVEKLDHSDVQLRLGDAQKQWLVN